MLGPDGWLLLVEHVRSPNILVRTIQRVLDTLARRFGGDNMLREPVDHLGAEGFRVDEVERSIASWVELTAATKPAA